MTSERQDKLPPYQRDESSSLGQFLFSLCMVAITVLAFMELSKGRFGGFSFDPKWDQETPAPLVMKGGDPYIRALMRTISASEANSPRPYSLIYGGEHFQDLSRHPDVCVPIVAGPNFGDCTTAAGRYQFLTDTWLEKAQQYHPQASQFRLWGSSYSFAPEFQDEVVYAWLSDPMAWGVDLSQLLRQGRLQEVLEILSPTWTSLGYGIESNVMTDSLPYIYEQVLQEELNQAPVFPNLFNKP